VKIGSVTVTLQLSAWTYLYPYLPHLQAYMGENTSA